MDADFEVRNLIMFTSRFLITVFALPLLCLCRAGLGPLNDALPHSRTVELLGRAVPHGVEPVTIPRLARRSGAASFGLYKRAGDDNPPKRQREHETQTAEEGSPKRQRTETGTEEGHHHAGEGSSHHGFGLDADIFDNDSPVRDRTHPPISSAKAQFIDRTLQSLWTRYGARMTKAFMRDKRVHDVGHNTMQHEPEFVPVRDNVSREVCAAL